jgi:hypothetical protein
MTAVQTSALATVREVRMIDVDHLLARLETLKARQLTGGFVSHGHGVRKCIELIKRDLAGQDGMAPVPTDFDSDDASRPSMEVYFYAPDGSRTHCVLHRLPIAADIPTWAVRMDVALPDTQIPLRKGNRG